MFGNTADDLAAHLTELLDAAEARELEKAAALNKRLIPSPEHAATLLATELPDGFLEALGTMLTRLPPADDHETWSKILRVPPGPRRIEVFSATGAQLAEGTVEGFPEEASKVAPALQADRTYHEVLIHVEGFPRPSEVHLVTWDGDGWTVLGPLWRLRRR